jgi:hypothetical protein
MAPAGPPPTMQHEVCSTSRISFRWVWKLEEVEGVVEVYPDAPITHVKMLDLVLWQTRE